MENPKTERNLPENLRLAKMGFDVETPSPEEIYQAVVLLQSIKRISRFGYQIPAYLLTAQDDGTFSGIVLPGTQSEISSIWSTIDHFKEIYGEDIEQRVPGCSETEYIDTFKISRDAKLSEITQRSTQQIVFMKKYMRNSDDATLAMGVPAIDTVFYGYPPYSAHSSRPSKALQVIEFKSKEAREKFEKLLIDSQKPLRLVNCLYSVLFSPDICTNLVGVNDSRKIGFIIKDGHPVGYDGGIEEALSDLAGLGFHYPFAEQRGGNDKPITA